MDFTRCVCFTVFFTMCIYTVQSYNSNRNNGLGFFPSILSPQLTNRQTFNSYVYPNTVPVSNYIRPVQPYYPAGMKTPFHIAPAPKLLYPALMPVGYPKVGTYPVHTGHGHAGYKPFYNHQDVVTKSVLTSVILSEILRRI